MSLNYLLTLLKIVPLFPLMYIQGKRIRAKVPKLPPATGLEGIEIHNGSAERMNILVIGESTMAGIGVDTHKEGFAGTFAKELSLYNKKSVSWKVYAKSGYTAQQVSEEIIPEIDDEKVDLVVIGLGGNDAFTINNPRKWSKAIEAIISQLQSKYPFAHIAFCNMPPIKAFPAFTPLIQTVVGNHVELLGETLRVLTSGKAGVFYNSEVITIDAWVRRYEIKEPASSFFSDGVHPSALTYQTWAKDMAAFVAKNAIDK